MRARFIFKRLRQRKEAHIHLAVEHKVHVGPVAVVLVPLQAALHLHKVLKGDVPAPVSLPLGYIQRRADADQGVAGHNACNRVGEALGHTPAEQLRLRRDTLPVALSHDRALMQHHECERRTAVGPLVHQRPGYRFQAGSGLRVARRQSFRPQRIGRERILLREERLTVLAAQQRDAVALTIGGGRFGPQEAARHRLVLVIHLVAVELYEGEMKVEGLHVGSIPPRHKHRRSQILGSIARNDGHQGVQIQAPPD